MGAQFSSTYSPAGPQVQMKILGGAYDGYFIGSSPVNSSLLTAVVPSLATSFTLDQSSTYVFIGSSNNPSGSYNFKPSGWGVPTINDTSHPPSSYYLLELRNETDVAKIALNDRNSNPGYSWPNGSPQTMGTGAWNGNPQVYGLTYTLASNYSVTLAAAGFTGLGLCAAASNTLFVYDLAHNYDLASGPCGASSTTLTALQAIPILPPAPSSTSTSPPSPTCSLSVELYVTNTTVWVTLGYKTSPVTTSVVPSTTGAGCLPVTSTMWLT